MRLDKSNVLVMVPAFNEQESVGAVLSALIDEGYATVLISDGSTDTTARVGRSLGVGVLELPINLGVGGALRAGFKHARRRGFAAVVQVDADGQHPIPEIARLIETANETGADLVIGSRFLESRGEMSIPGIRRIVMWVLARSATGAAGRAVTDSTSGFRLIREPLLEQFCHHFANNYLGDTYEAVVSAGRAGYTVIEIPATLMERTHGESTASTGSAVRFTLKGLGVAFLGLHKRLRPITASQT